MRDLNDFYYFVCVVDHGGFAAAARAVNMQKSKLSRRILQLEDRLGVRLVNRSSRRFSVTDLGLGFYDRCVAMLAEADAADQVVADVRSELKGLIRVSCPAASLQDGLGPLFARFVAENPGVDLVLDSTNRYVAVIGEGYDLSIRARFPPFESSELITRRLYTVDLCLVAAPSLIEGRTMGSPADLAGLPGLALGPADGEQFWRLARSDGHALSFKYSPHLVSDDMNVLRDAALAGAGVVRLPVTFVADDLKRGGLVHVLADWSPENIVIEAAIPSRRGMMPSVRALIDFLAAGSAARKTAG